MNVKWKINCNIILKQPPRFIFYNKDTFHMAEIVFVWFIVCLLDTAIVFVLNHSPYSYNHKTDNECPQNLHEKSMRCTRTSKIHFQALSPKCHFISTLNSFVIVILFIMSVLRKSIVEREVRNQNGTIVGE